MKKCVVCGRECDRLTKGMCAKHYSQYRRHGKILENTKYEPNKIVEYEDRFSILEDAIEARKKAEIKYFGEYRSKEGYSDE